MVLTKSPADTASKIRPTVYIVDDDVDIRTKLSQLLSTVGLHTRSFTSGREFLENVSPDCVGCMVCDVRMPMMSGLELLERLGAEDYDLPVVIVTAHADVPMAVSAMKLGAIEFLEKPVRPQVLLDHIQGAMSRHIETRERRNAVRAIEERLAKLTPRESEVVDLVVEGLTSKEIATRLQLSPKTVHVHRAEAMAKLNAGSVADLVRMVVYAREAGRASTEQ
jgi:RNA polymerase sigma factor (sigma-70 family)